jgi:hypothetical protein
VVCVTAPREGRESRAGAGTYGGINYRERVFGDLNRLIDRALEAAEVTYYGGEAVPHFWPSFGAGEVAAFCGAELRWSEDSGDTNWSQPFVEEWEEALPLRLREESPLWQRMLELYRLAAERLEGKMALAPLDLHTNLDLLAAVRGPERLCLDLVERPEAVDEAMTSARAVFRELWKNIVRAGRMEELGYCHFFYSMKGAAILQCDFSYMIGPEMFRRWALPALEEEAEVVKHAYYHWDGPGALAHLDSLCGSRGLHTLSYVPGAGRGWHSDYLDLFKRVQAGGKAVHFFGSSEQLKAAHRELRPEKVAYGTHVGSEREAEKLLEWFRRNT